MTAMKIRSDPMATWECTKQVRRPLNFSASVTHAHCILGSSRKTRIDPDDDDVHLQFAELELLYQIVKIHKFLNMQEGQGRPRPCHWMIYQELCQLIIRGGQSLLCWILLKNVEITNPKT